VNKWLKRIRGAVGMGLTWSAGWAVSGILIGVASKLLTGLPFWDSFFEIFDAPLPALAIPAFFGGVLFSIALGIAGRRRRFEELSLSRFAALGAVGGLLLSLLPAAMVGVGLASLGTESHGLWDLTAIIAGPLIILCSVSASGSLLLARRAKTGSPLDQGGNEEGLPPGSEPTGFIAAAPRPSTARTTRQDSLTDHRR
jgi:hypothetical protein